MNQTKILISRNDKLGDFVLATPVFYALKKYNPDLILCALVSPLGKEIASKLDVIDEIIVDEGDSSTDLSKKIKAFNPDIALTIFSTFRIGLAIFLAGVGFRVAPATKLAQIFYNYRKKQKRSKVAMREFEYNLDLLTMINEKIDTSFEKPLWNVGSLESTEKLRSELGVSGKKVIGFHAGFGGSSIGNITKEEYIELGKIAFKAGIVPMFTFGPDEYKMREEIEEKVDYDAVFYESKDGVWEFTKLLSTLEAFVCTSTGTLHLAGAVNTPTFAFFGDTLIASAKRWGTLSEEKNQHNYTIFEEEARRLEQLKNIKEDFEKFCKDING